MWTAWCHHHANKRTLSTVGERYGRFFEPLSLVGVGSSGVGLERPAATSPQRKAMSLLRISRGINVSLPGGLLNKENTHGGSLRAKMRLLFRCTQSLVSHSGTGTVNHLDFWFVV